MITTKIEPVLTKVQIHVVEGGFTQRMPGVGVVQQSAVDPSITEADETRDM